MKLTPRVLLLALVLQPALPKKAHADWFGAAKRRQELIRLLGVFGYEPISKGSPLLRYSNGIEVEELLIENRLAAGPFVASHPNREGDLLPHRLAVGALSLPGTFRHQVRHVVDARNSPGKNPLLAEISARAWRDRSTASIDVHMAFQRLLEFVDKGDLHHLQPIDRMLRREQIRLSPALVMLGLASGGVFEDRQVLLRHLLGWKGREAALVSLIESYGAAQDKLREAVVGYGAKYHQRWYSNHDALLRDPWLYGAYFMCHFPPGGWTAASTSLLIYLPEELVFKLSRYRMLRPFMAIRRVYGLPFEPPSGLP